MDPRRPTLTAAVDRAIAGDRKALIELLCRGSGLPGPRANVDLALSFAAECASRGKSADALVTYFTTLDPELAPGGGSGTYGAGSELEFLPICGVMACGARAAKDERARGPMLALLHDAAEDLRFRVRDAVPLALEAAGVAMGDALVAHVGEWMDGYFHAAAVLRAIVRMPWLAQVKDTAGVCELYERAFSLAEAAPRAAARYPGFKALAEALSLAIAPLAARVGVPFFDMLASLSRCKDPVLRELVTGALSKGNLVARHRADVTRVLAAFSSTAKPVRDPRSLPGPTRKRGGGRRR